MKVHQTIPLLVVSDIKASLAFYRDGLGFRTAGTWEPDGALAWCRLEHGDAALMLQQACPEDPPAADRGHGVQFYFLCEEADAAYRAFVARGIETTAPAIAFYGMNQVFVTDPDGYRLCFESETSPGRNWSVLHATWEEHADQLVSVRTIVFVDEQGVDPELEQDGRDPDCRHALARLKSGRPIGTGRLDPTGHIGRVAVLAEHRRSGIGTALMQALIDIARECGYTQVGLHAQSHALAFYERLGFTAHGDEFMEAGIPHRHMVLEL